MEDLQHMDALHNRFARLRYTAVNIAAVLQLQILSGAEGQGWHVPDGHGKGHALALQDTFQKEAICGQAQCPMPHVRKLSLGMVDHADRYRSGQGGH